MNIACPFCGRHVPENVFDPSNFADDIYGVNVTGLGRGMGFRVTGQFSLLGDPTLMGLMSDRCHRILHLIHQQGYLPPQELNALRSTLDQWVKHGRKLEAENAELREETLELSNTDDYEEDIELSRLLRKINMEVGYQFDNLIEAVEYLLEL